ncbi:MAG: cyclase family protein [Planctomycetes bacterium]|nr:cyclase family protein [Planctomycetota bacterium]
MIYDISPPITLDIAVWPGDTPPTRQVLLDMAKGDNLTLSTLHSTVHLGSHVDGPNHYGLGEPGIGEQQLEAYIGPCQVIHVSVERGMRIEPDQMKMPIDAERVLIATGTYPDPNNFNEDFAALSPELVDQLHEEGVILVGIDTPSVDLFESKDLPAHKRFLENEIAILEGIVLKDVPDGIYELIALPLKLIGFDASPVRAILREKGDLKHGGPRRATEEERREEERKRGE